MSQRVTQAELAADVIDGLDDATPGAIERATAEFPARSVAAAAAAAASGASPGGSQPFELVQIPVSFDTPGLTEGIEIYDPAEGELLFCGLSYVKIIQAFDGDSDQTFKFGYEGEHWNYEGGVASFTFITFPSAFDIGSYDLTPSLLGDHVHEFVGGIPLRVSLNTGRESGPGPDFFPGDAIDPENNAGQALITLVIGTP